MIVKMNARLPIYFGGGAIILLAVVGVVVAAIRGGLTPVGVGVALACVVSLAGVPVLLWMRSSTPRMPNRVPGFGLRFGGDGGHRSAEDLSEFLAEFVLAWRVHVDTSTAALVETINSVDVEWRPGNTFRDGTRELYGVTRSPTHVVVAVREGRTLGATALAHELVHAHLWRTTGDPDRDHSASTRGGRGWDDRHDRLLIDLAML